jgi:hemerythrin-like domain-containing protein
VPMRPTEILSSEHRAIERALDVLLALVRNAANGGGLDRRGACLVVEFLREFADVYHHGKEEQRLFPALEALGMPRHAGPLAVMLQEHELGRQYVSAMGVALEAEDDGAFIPPAEGFVALLRDHIAKEDGVLFPMADSMLDGTVTAELSKAFEVVEAQNGGRALKAQVEELATALALPASLPSTGTGVCGFGGGCHGS